MADHPEPRVAVYIDFDNIVISRYDLLHGKGQFFKDKIRHFNPTHAAASVVTKQKLVEATVDISAVVDFASSFGSIVISRAYADWSIAVNSSYRQQLIDRAVDLTQLFPTVLSLKNGADIRLAVDVVEDLFRLPDLTHVVIVAGDSDYIALAQRAKRLGRFVVGVGVSGSTSRSLISACDQFADYDDLPGVADAAILEAVAAEPDPVAREPKTASLPQSDVPPSVPARAALSQQAATKLLIRALENGAKDEDGWLASGGVKSQMQRMDPAFNEKSLKFSSFTDFVKSRGSHVEINERQSGGSRLRLRPTKPNS